MAAGARMGGGGSRHRTIGSAVRAAREGAVIAIAAGVYHENLVLDKSVTLLAEGDDGTVELVAGNGPAIAVRAGDATVRGLALRGSGPDAVACLRQASRWSRPRSAPARSTCVVAPRSGWSTAG